MDTLESIKRRTTDILSSIPSTFTAKHHADDHGAHMRGSWEKIQVPPLPRSSHSVDVVTGTAYVFGGEAENARQPTDNDMHAIVLPSGSAPADYYAIKAKSSRTTDTSDEKNKSPETDESSEIPAPRVGHASAVIGHRIFLFGGRGGPEMTPLDEAGRVWVFDTRTHFWSYLDPVSPISGNSPAVPEPRSYHSAVATDKPRNFNKTSHTKKHSHDSRPATSSSTSNNIVGDIGEGLIKRTNTIRDWATADRDVDEIGTPQRPIVGKVAEHAVDPDVDGYGTFIIHGGCIADGKRTSDVWAFDIHSRVWQQLPDAPGPARGGAALALSRNRLYRFGGFNGETQEGGQLDYLELVLEEFDDQFGKGDASISAKDGWKSLLQGKEDVGYKEPDPAPVPTILASQDPEEADQWPGARSVAGFEAITVGGGREYLVLFLGEREGSGKGHDAAGKFYDDVWVYQVPAEGMSMASVTDRVKSVVGRKSREGQW